MIAQDYIAALRARLDGKRPTGDFKDAKGNIVFVFDHQSSPTRATVSMGPQGAHVHDGKLVDDGTPTAIVFAALPDWIALFENAQRDSVAKIHLYGDTWLLNVLMNVTFSTAAAARQAGSEDALGWSTTRS